MENSAIRARKREGRDRTRRQNEFCLTSPEGEEKNILKKEKETQKDRQKMVSYSRWGRSLPPRPLIDCQNWQTPPAEEEKEKKDSMLDW